MTSRLEDIQDTIIARLHAGEPVDRDALLEAHPDHAEALKGFFGVMDVIEAPPALGGAEPTTLGEFMVLKEIGRGGMGVVYEAEQASLKRRVALKVLPAALARHERVVERFRREAEAAGRLRHPGIVPVFSVGEAAGTPFFAMELVDGDSLAEILSARRAGDDRGLPPAGEAWRRWAVQLTARIADAIHYAHGQGILHRDIKPGNVILDDKGAPRVTDFGLALDLHADGLTLTGESLGTPQYMSPEQLVQRAQGIDVRTDVYSLAVTLYELLTLRLPYDADSTPALFAALQGGKIVAPRSVDADIEPDLERVLMRALRLDPGERYADAAAFATDLRSVLQREPIAPQPRVSRRPVRITHRVGGLAVALGALILLSVIAFQKLGNRPVGVPEVPEVPTAADWVRLAGGGFEDPHVALKRWLQVDFPLRRYQRRLRPDTAPLPRVTHALAADDDVSVSPRAVVLIVRWERRLAGERWREIGYSWQYVTDARQDTRFIWRMGAAALGIKPAQATQKGLAIEHRGRLRLMPRPSGWGKGERPADFWTDLSGITATLSHTQTVAFVDELPADYPEAVVDPAIDAEVQALLKAASPRIDATRLVPNRPGTPIVHVRFGTLERAPPVPVVGWAEVWSSDGSRRLASGHLWVSPLVTRIKKWGPVLPLDAGVDPSEVRAAKTLRLRLRGDRSEALKRRPLESFWGGSLEWVVPVYTGD